MIFGYRVEDQVEKHGGEILMEHGILYSTSSQKD